MEARWQSTSRFLNLRACQFLPHFFCVLILLTSYLKTGKMRRLEEQGTFSLPRTPSRRPLAGVQSDSSFRVCVLATGTPRQRWLPREGGWGPLRPPSPSPLCWARLKPRWALGRRNWKGGRCPRSNLWGLGLRVSLCSCSALGHKQSPRL